MWVRAFIALFATSCIPAVTSAQVQPATRVTPYDWQCQDENGRQVGGQNYSRFDTAFVSCLNAADGRFLQGGRYRMPPKPSAPPSPPPVPSPQPTLTPVVLNWQIPTHEPFGTGTRPLTSPVVGFRLTWGRTPAATDGSIEVGVVTTHTLNLESGTWYQRIAAKNALGEWSDISNPSMKVNP